MPSADPALVILLASAIILAFGSPPRLIDLPYLGFRFAHRLSASPQLERLLEPLLALSMGLLGTWLLAQALPLYLQAFIGQAAATALATAFAVMILWSGSESTPPLRRFRLDEDAGLLWTRGFVVPVLLYSLFGVYAPVLYKFAILFGGSSRLALVLASAVHSPVARLSALALCLVHPQRRRLWDSLIHAQLSPGPWRREELRALLIPPSHVRAALLSASVMLVLLLALWTRWP
jgi:hypothetical protein